MPKVPVAQLFVVGANVVPPLATAPPLDITVLDIFNPLHIPLLEQQRFVLFLDCELKFYRHY